MLRTTQQAAGLQIDPGSGVLRSIVQQSVPSVKENFPAASAACAAPVRTWLHRNVRERGRMSYARGCAGVTVGPVSVVDSKDGTHRCRGRVARGRVGAMRMWMDGDCTPGAWAPRELRSTCRVTSVMRESWGYRPFTLIFTDGFLFARAMISSAVMPATLSRMCAIEGFCRSGLPTTS